MVCAVVCLATDERLRFPQHLGGRYAMAFVDQPRLEHNRSDAACLRSPCRHIRERLSVIDFPNLKLPFLIDVGLFPCGVVTRGQLGAAHRVLVIP